MLDAVADQPDDIGDLFDSGGAQLTDHYAERQLLGYLLNKPGAITETVDILRPEDLHDPIHRRLYELLLRAYDLGEPPSMASLATGLGGEKAANVFVASLISHTDMQADVAEVADQLSIIAERRAVGTVDDVDFDRGAPFVSKFGAMRWEEIGASDTPHGYTWFVEDIFPMGEISLAFGDSGTGKSFDMFDMGMAGARGIMWNGRNVEPGLVVYVAAEAGKGFAKRKIAYSMQHKLEPSEPLPFVLITKRPNFFHDDTDCLALIEEIKALCRMYRVPLVCIVIDTLSALAPGMNENASQDVSMVRKRLVMLQDTFTASIILVHHKPKGGTTPRGHGSLTADFETTVEFETVYDKKTDTGKVLHRGTVRKQREGKSGLYWEFTLPVVEVGRNKWGNPETSCVVEPYTVGGQKAAPVGFHATPNEKLFMRALYDALVDHPVPPPVGLPKSIAHAVNSEHVRTLLRSRTINPHEDKAVSDARFRQAFKRAGDKLRDGGVIGVQGELFWVTGKPVNGFSTTGG
jgi:hypothetical protein